MRASNACAIASEVRLERPVGGVVVDDEHALSGQLTRGVIFGARKYHGRWGQGQPRRPDKDGDRGASVQRHERGCLRQPVRKHEERNGAGQQRDEHDSPGHVPQLQSPPLRALRAPLQVAIGGECGHLKTAAIVCRLQPALPCSHVPSAGPTRARRPRARSGTD